MLSFCLMYIVTRELGALEDLVLRVGCVPQGRCENANVNTSVMRKNLRGLLSSSPRALFGIVWSEHFSPVYPV